MPVTFTVKLGRNPLRHTYVSHYDFFRVPQTLFTVTNAGRANLTADPNGPSGNITVRVHAQNSVVRVLDNGLPVPFEVAPEFSVVHNGLININPNRQQAKYFDIMQKCFDAYDIVFRHFPPFNATNRGLFPFGKASTLVGTRNKLPRIEVAYPDNSPVQLPYVEPVFLSTGYPLIHLKKYTISSKLIAHELAHALHFALMSQTTRASVQTQYLGWILGRLGAGLPPYHGTTLVTTPFIAWIEAFGLFAWRYFEFSRQSRNRGLSVSARQNAFLRENDSYAEVGTLNPGGSVSPSLAGDNVEGAVYGAVFLDYARRVGLSKAVGEYLNSAKRNVLTFDDFRNLVSNSDIRDVANRWGL